MKSDASTKAAVAKMGKPKLYRVRFNSQLHESVELEIEHYRYLYDCGVDEGEISEEGAEQLFKYTEKIFEILQRALGRGVTSKEIAKLHEVSAARAIRKDMRIPM